MNSLIRQMRKSDTKMITAITYGDDNYKKSVQLNLWSAKVIGKADCTRAFGRNDIDEVFMKKNSHILACKRGGGYWLWKPYIIDKALKEIEYGEYLMYADAGLYYIHDLHVLVHHLERDKKDVFLSSSILPNQDWTKHDVFTIMECEKKEAKKMHLIEAGYLLLRKTDHSLNFVKEWLCYAQNYDMITDVPSKTVEKEVKSFRENRHDQSILTCLAYKYQMTPYKGISGRSEYKSYVLYRDGEFYGYSREELLKYSLDEMNKEYFMNSQYGRIVINTRIDTNNYLVFALKFLKKTLQAIYIDTIAAAIANRALKIERP